GSVGGLGGSSRLRGGLGGAGAGGQRRQQVADLHGGALGGQHLAAHAGFGCVDLDGDLVGLELNQQLVAGDRIAGLDRPLADGRLRNRFRQLRDADFNCHDRTSLRLRPSASADPPSPAGISEKAYAVSASSTSLACCWLCLLIRPVAGDAASRRPAYSGRFIFMLSSVSTVSICGSM